MDTFLFYLKAYKAQAVFFTIFLLATIPMLYYYRRRNPNPRFRPSAGEMLMVTIFALFLNGAVAFGLGSLFSEDQDFRKLAERPTIEQMRAASGGTPADPKRGGGGAEKEKPDEAAEIMGVIGSQKRK
jgi:hypothetical protein